MKTLVFGAGPLGSLYAHLLHKAGSDVTLLARGQRYEAIKSSGLTLVNEMTGRHDSSSIKVVDRLEPNDDYDLTLVLIRKNKLVPVLEVIAANTRIENVLFMGNNALGFEDYLKVLPEERVLFGFPGAGGGISGQTVHYADREKPRSRPRAVTLGEIDGVMRDRTRRIRSLLEAAGIPVKLTRDIDGWLKYHVALVAPLVCGLYKHNCDNYALAEDRDTIRMMVEAAKEGGRVLKSLGYGKRQPFEFNLFYWFPQVFSVKALQSLLTSKFAEVAFALHAKAAQEEMIELADEFQSLVGQTSIDTPNIAQLSSYMVRGNNAAQAHGK